MNGIRILILTTLLLISCRLSILLCELCILCASPRAIAVARAAYTCVVDTFWAAGHVLLGLFLQRFPPGISIGDKPRSPDQLFSGVTRSLITTWPWVLRPPSLRYPNYLPRQDLPILGAGPSITENFQSYGSRRPRSCKRDRPAVRKRNKSTVWQGR